MSHVLFNILYLANTCVQSLTDTAERLADFYIRVGQTFDQGSFDPTTYTQCAYQSAALGNGETRMFYCDTPIVGRYVTVHFPPTRTEVLTLCEVAVYGEIIKEGESFSCNSFQNRKEATNSINLSENCV